MPPVQFLDCPRSPLFASEEKSPTSVHSRNGIHGHKSRPTRKYFIMQEYFRFCFIIWPPFRFTIVFPFGRRPIFDSPKTYSGNIIILFVADLYIIFLNEKTKQNDTHYYYYYFIVVQR